MPGLRGPGRDLVAHASAPCLVVRAPESRNPHHDVFIARLYYYNEFTRSSRSCPTGGRYPARGPPTAAFAGVADEKWRRRTQRDKLRRPAPELSACDRASSVRIEKKASPCVLNC